MNVFLVIGCVATMVVAVPTVTQNNAPASETSPSQPSEPSLEPPPRPSSIKDSHTPLRQSPHEASMTMSQPQVREVMDRMMGHMFSGLPAMMGFMPPPFMFNSNPLNSYLPPSPYGLVPYSPYSGPDYARSMYGGIGGPSMYDMSRLPTNEQQPLSAIEPPRPYLSAVEPRRSSLMLRDPLLKDPRMMKPAVPDHAFRSRYQAPVTPPKPVSYKSPKAPANARRPTSSKFWSKIKKRYGKSKKSFYQRINAKHTTTSSINFKTRVPHQLFERFPFSFMRGLFINPRLMGLDNNDTNRTDTNTTDTNNTDTNTTDTNTTTTTDVAASPDTTTNTKTANTRSSPQNVPSLPSSFPYNPKPQEITFASRDMAKNADQNAGPSYQRLTL